MLLGILVALGVLTVLWVAWNLTLDALWQPSDRITVRRMLVLAGVSPQDHVVDLGCGDGRVVVAAARDFGAKASGVEIDPIRVLWGKLWIWLAGVARRADIRRGNMYDADLSEADVVVLFLSPISNLRLQEKLKRELRPGSRVVSYYHDMWGWKPAEVGESKRGYPVYLYRIGEAS